ncbi:tripartite tricarboxylate transporter substrate binding protein [Alcaligenaceae bacterium LF4-65]|jgi:tripartite-type tricarboxylate transporter receptor subunit TctC|uniref:Tripartite tricarboxylate transporter substrate binding protein n=1 Tax=Zwartia hollandica TaxID=324606 RepID=A0A953NBF5_9BURK|nr:tripartite tricarboxylate transporter substrate binding protein [Zwartia hollandica]MBZ1350205.1 tripartite tricarboxylate transporter substrate binding protein [Zwartia hollandica]
MFLKKYMPVWALALGLTAGGSAAAQSVAFPTQPIRLVVGFPAGGASDVAARAIASQMTIQLGQQVIVENKPGAASNIGAEFVAKSKPDGYTLLLGTISTSINGSLYKNLNYNPSTDFVAISQIASTAFLLVSNPSSPYKTVADIIAAAKKAQGTSQLPDYATAGNGSGSHLFTELFASMAGIKLNHIPYRGAAPAVADVMGGQVPITFDNILTTLAQTKSGKLHAIAVSTKTRSSVAPEIPTIAESGVPGYDATAWFGIFAPKGTPTPIVNKLAESIQAAVRTPAVTEVLLKSGAEPVGSTPAQFDAFYKAEVAKWAQVVKNANVKID